MRATDVFPAALAQLLAVSTLVGCSDAYLEPRAAESTNIDDRLTISGRVCTAPPDRTGFPVKVVLIVDQSGSMCVSDPPGSQESSGFCEAHAYVPPGVTQPGRVLALNRLLEQFQSQPNVQVALVPFETNVKGVWPTAGAGGQHFARPDSTLRNRVNTLQAELGKGTDYQGALATAYAIIASDIFSTNQATPELLPRTKYVVVFLTDGTPFPRCAGNDQLTEYADDLHPDLLWADSFGAGGDGPDNFCNQIEPDDPDAITGFVKGTDRNQNYQLYSYVNQLMELKKVYNIGDIRLNTVLLFNEEAVRACGDICQDLYGEYVRYPGKVRVADGPAAARRIAQYLLKKMADLGNGVYQEYNDFGGIGVLNLGSLNYTSLASSNVMKTLLVQPLSSEPGPLDLKDVQDPSNASLEIARVIDTDGDGLPDELDNDFTHTTNPFLADSDEDGFDDSFEVSRYSDGFRPNEKDGRGCDPNSPLTPGCHPRDTDGDGLSQYAETYLHTRSTLVDSDGDGVPDGMEVRYGLDPLSPLVAGLDTDGDGVPDAEELRFGSNPIRRDRDYLAKHGFQYTVVAETQSDESICYDFSVSNVQLVTPPNKAGLRQGFNLFKVWFGEAPEGGVATDYGVWKTGCVWAQYDPPSIRVPAGPSATPLTDANFVAPSLLADRAGYDARCVGVSPSQGQLP